MKFRGAFLATLVSVTLAAPSAKAQSEAFEAMEHLKKACEAVWKTGTPYQVDRCTRRAMAALGDENRLRDNELKRLLNESERELKTCSEELEEVQGELTRREAASAKGEAPKTARRKP